MSVFSPTSSKDHSLVRWSGESSIVPHFLGTHRTIDVSMLLRPCVLTLLDREGSTLRDLATGS
jgi:hypothetical protein